MTRPAATPEPEPKRGGRSITVLVVADLVDRYGIQQPATTHAIVADLVARDALGFERYGQNLETHDGRNTLNDLYQELLDGAQYARKAIEEGLDNAHLRSVYRDLLAALCDIRHQLDDQKEAEHGQ